MILTRGQKLLVIVWATAAAATFLFPRTACIQLLSSRATRTVWEGYAPIFYTPQQIKPYIDNRARRDILFPQVFLQFGALTIIFGAWLFLSLTSPRNKDDEVCPNQSDDPAIGSADIEQP